MVERTSLRKISAPPPVNEFKPAPRSSESVSLTDFLASHARCKISIAVKHFNCSRGALALGVAQASPPASSCTVPVQGAHVFSLPGSETLPELAAGTAALRGAGGF